MAYKLGFILSLIFLVQLFILLGDIVSIQMINTNLDAVSVTAGYLISQSGRITDQVRNLVMNEAGATIESTGEESPLIGGLFTFKITREYEPLIIKEDVMEISVERSVVIGYFNPVGKEKSYVRNQGTITWDYSNNLNLWSRFSCYDSSL